MIQPSEKPKPIKEKEKEKKNWKKKKGKKKPIFNYLWVCNVHNTIFKLKKKLPLDTKCLTSTGSWKATTTNHK